MHRGLLAAGALVVFGRAAAAQVDTTPRHPPVARRDTSAVPDSAARDSTAPDSAAPDTIEHFLPVFAPDIAPGPLPRGTRWSFDADSLVLSDIATLADLLGHLPGVYVARGGLFGAAEIAVYGGRGPMGLEVYWDGVPYLPLGRDSIWLDPARIPLAPLERIDIQMLPATLRVFLITIRARSTVPRTEVRISTGDASIAQYQTQFAKRWRSGPGLSVTADYRNIDGLQNNSTTAFNSVDLWLHTEYVRRRVGLSVQIVSSAWDRGAAAGLVEGWKQRRVDDLFQAFVASREDGLGERLTMSIAHTAVSGDPLVHDRSQYQAVVALSETRSRLSLGVRTRFQGSARPLQIEANAAWRPLPPVTVSADARRSQYGDKGHGLRAHVAAGLQLPLGVSVRAEASRVEDFQAPLVRSDSFQRATDLAGYVRWDRRWITLEAGAVQRDSFRPRSFSQGILTVAALGPVPRSTYASVFLGLRPVPGVQLSGWYFDPVKGGGDFEPPTHSRISAVFFSKFWRVYRSGAFALRGEVSAESWSRSNLGGRDSTGAQLPLRPASFVETNIELRIGDFTAYWQTRNYNGMRGSYVPGLGYPKHAQYYGVQWYFRN